MKDVNETKRKAKAGVDTFKFGDVLSKKNNETFDSRLSFLQSEALHCPRNSAGKQIQSVFDFGDVQFCDEDQFEKQDCG